MVLWPVGVSTATLLNGAVMSIISGSPVSRYFGIFSHHLNQKGLILTLRPSFAPSFLTPFLNRPALTPKLPVETFVHQEVYHDYDAQRIDEFYCEKENSEETANILKENPDCDNLAQVFTKHRYTQPDNEHFAKVLMETLERQGFRV